VIESARGIFEEEIPLRPPLEIQVFSTTKKREEGKVLKRDNLGLGRRGHNSEGTKNCVTMALPSVFVFWGGGWWGVVVVCVWVGGRSGDADPPGSLERLKRLNQGRARAGRPWLRAGMTRVLPPLSKNISKKEFNRIRGRCVRVTRPAIAALDAISESLRKDNARGDDSGYEKMCRSSRKRRELRQEEPGKKRSVAFFLSLPCPHQRSKQRRRGWICVMRSGPDPHTAARRQPKKCRGSTVGALKGKVSPQAWSEIKSLPEGGAIAHGSKGEGI